MDKVVIFMLAKTGHLREKLGFADATKDSSEVIEIGSSPTVSCRQWQLALSREGGYQCIHEFLHRDPETRRGFLDRLG